MSDDGTYQQVTSPDGTIHLFPEEATPEQIAKALGIKPPKSLDTSPPPETAANLEGDSTFRPKGVTGDFVGDSARYALTAAVRGGANLADYVPNLVNRTFSTPPGSWEAIANLPPNPTTEQKNTALRAILPPPEKGPANALADKFFAKNVSEFAPQGPAGRMGLAASEGAVETLPFGAASAGMGALSAASESLASNYTDNPLLRGAAAMAPVLLPVARNAMLPDMDKGVAKLASRLSDLGVELKAPQILPGGKASLGDVGQVRQYTRAVSRLMGEDTDRITNDTIDQVRTHAQTTLDDVASRTGLLGSPYFRGTLDSIENDAKIHYPVGSPQLAAVQHQLNTIRTEITTHPMAGDTYQYFTKKAGPVSRLSSDPMTSEFGQRIRTAMDDELERTAVQIGDPGAIRDLQQARQQYRHVNMIGPMVNDTTGLIDPQKFQAAAKRSYSDYKGGYASNTPDDVVTLAEGGKFLPSPTAQGDAKTSLPSNMLKTAAKYGTGSVGVGMGLAAGEHIGPELLDLAKTHPHLAMGAAALGGSLLAGQRARSAYVNSPGYRNLLIRKALGDTSLTPNLLAAPGMIATDQESR